MQRRYNTIWVEQTQGGETQTLPKVTPSVLGYIIAEHRFSGVVIETDTDDAQHAEMVADPDIYEQIGGPVPKQISRSQAMLALKLTPSPTNPAPATLHSDIEGYIETLNLTPPLDPSDPDYAAELATYQANLMAYTAWFEEPYFERLSPAINGLGNTLGLSQDDLDDLFRSALTINV